MAAEAATVIQLIHFSGMVLSACYEYISKAKDAPKEIQRAIDEVSSLEGILKNLKPLAEAPEDDRFVILKSLNRNGGPFDACTSALKDVDKRLEALNKLPSLRRKLQWPLEAGKIEATIQNLGEHKISFILALAGQSAIDGEDMRKKIDDTKSTVEDTKSTVDDLKAKQLHERMMVWMRGADPSTNHNAAQKKKEAGTCEWLTSSKQFEAFLAGENQLMWMHGIPGAGKTILSAAVIDHITANDDLGEKKVIYYYFDFNDHAKQTCSGFLLSLVRQICAQANTAPSDIVNLHTDCNGASPSPEQLIETLISLLSQNSRTYIVIDALDECKEEEEEEERRAVLDALREMKSSPAGPFNIFVASRPEIDIAREMEDLCDIDLDIQAALVDEDIRCHVRSCLAKDARLKRWPENVKKEIEEKLTNNANGMFRWVVCQLAELRKCLKLANLRLELGNLPKTLDATYTRILKNVPSIHQREMRMILEFLTFSTRPMTLQEVAEATSVNLEQQVFDIEDRFPDPFDLLAVCSSLVSTSTVPEDNQSPIWREGPYRWNTSEIPEDLRMLQFAHFSVKEYILSERAHQQLHASFIIGESLSHSQIAQTCLIYLLDFSNGKRISKFEHTEFPFLAYAALNWTSHLALTTTDERDKIDALVGRLFDAENDHHLMNYLNLFDPDKPSHFSSQPGRELRLGVAVRNKRDFQPPIYYACHHGLGKVVEYLLSGDEKARPDKEALGSGLAAAASQGHLDIVDLLLKHGADPNSPYSGKHWRPLHAAASSGNPRIVQKLLDAGSLVDSQGGNDGAPLNVAAENGNTEVIQLLIDHGAPLYSSCEYRGPPLSTAILKKNEEAAKVLVRNKVDVNIPPDGYLNPLNLACAECSVDTVRLLLDNGAETALKPLWSRALHNACERGAMDIMQLLVERGAHVNGDTNGVYTTPLKAAIQAEGRDIEVFQFMLRNGADINFRGSGVKYPLDQALFGGNLKAAEILIELGAQFGDEGLQEALDYLGKEYLAKMLIDRGANVNAEESRFGNILQFAAMRSSATAVRWLLEAGSDPNDVPDGEHGTALQAAVYRGKENIVRLLLEFGAAVNPPRPSGESGFPLHAAIWGKEEAIAELLIDHGADINVSGGKKTGTPLELAAGAGSEKLVKSLIAKGAEINPPPSGKYGTPLCAALANNHEDIVKFLLENGAQFSEGYEAHHSTTQGVRLGRYSSALEVAAASNDPKLVQLLIDRGLKINAGDEASSRALARASEAQGSSMLEYFIAEGADVKKYGGAALALCINRRYDNALLQKVQLLLKHGADPNGDSDGGLTGLTPLANSIYNSQPDVMKLLLDSGCNVNATYSVKYFNGSALNEAINKIELDMVKVLISRGADVNLKAGSLGTPLTIAISKGEEELFRLLLEHGAEVNPSPSYGYYGTPLHSAIQRGYYEIANELLDKGADPNAAGYYASPLTGACGYGKTGQIDLIKRLLDAGADIEAEDKPRPEDNHLTGTRFYWTPLQQAAYVGKENIVELLLERGAEINPSSPKGTHGFPLQAAVKNKSESMVKLLLERGADVNAVGGEYGTALQAAAKGNSDALVSLLLEAGADPKLEGGTFGSPLQAASMIGKDRHVQIFLDRGVAVNTSVGKYGNPLAAACKRAQRSTVEILIAAGADVNQPGGKYGSPLQAACCAVGSTAKDEAGSVVKMLLEKGAEINAEGGKYGTALQAAAYHDRKYVQILLEKNADPNIRGGKFKSALNAARKKGFMRAEKLLLDHGAEDEAITEESTAD